MTSGLTWPHAKTNLSAIYFHVTDLGSQCAGYPLLQQFARQAPAALLQETTDKETSGGLEGGTYTADRLIDRLMDGLID